MKFRVTMKDPDVLHDAIEEAVDSAVDKMDGLDADEREAVKDKRKENVADSCCAWFKYGEYLTVEVDTDAKTCVVVPNKD